MATLGEHGPRGVGSNSNVASLQTALKVSSWLPLSALHGDARRARASRRRFKLKCRFAPNRFESIVLAAFISLAWRRSASTGLAALIKLKYLPGSKPQLAMQRRLHLQTKQKTSC